MALTELRLSHFRSHKTTRLVFDQRPIAIYGPNGAGKTNVLEAVSLFSPGRGLRRVQADELPRLPEGIGWKLSAVIESQHQTHECETWADMGAGRKVTIDGKASSQTALGRVLRMVWLVPSMDRLWIEGADGRRRFLDRIALSFEPSHAELSLSYEKAMRERNRLLKDQVRDAFWYTALEQQMAKTGVAIQSNRAYAISRLTDAQSQASATFPTAELALTSSDGDDMPDTADAYAEALADNRQRDLYAGRTLIGPHRADLDAQYVAKAMPAKRCSTGEQKALLISLILANARALSEDIGTAPILLLDEVAAHLDKDRRAALYAEICALETQAWMTGTGYDLFAELGSRAQCLEVREVGGLSETRIHEM